MSPEKIASYRSRETAIGGLLFAAFALMYGAVCAGLLPGVEAITPAALMPVLILADASFSPILRPIGDNIVSLNCGAGS